MAKYQLNFYSGHSFLDMDLAKTIVIGNSGAGKSWLSERLANRLQADWIDLDQIHWQPGGYNVARDRKDAIRMAQKAAEADRWVIEGIYGWLISPIQSTATALIWLCIDDAECSANILRRGVRGGGSNDTFAELLRWTETYRVRRGSSSYNAHERIFNSFAGAKKRLSNRDEVTRFANSSMD
jgi:adenylate kinase family enzyme